MDGGPNQGAVPTGGRGPLDQIGLATKNRRVVSWPKLVLPDEKRPQSASLRLSPKSEKPVAKVGAKQGRGQTRSWSDPTHSTLQDAMKKARSQVHVRPVDGVSHPQKRSSSVRRRGSECAAQGTGSPCAGSEEEGLAEGEVRLVAHLKMSFLPFIEFWPFLGLRIFSMFLPQNEFWPFKGPS